MAALLCALKGADRGAPPFASRFYEPQGCNPMRNPHDNIRGDPEAAAGQARAGGMQLGPSPRAWRRTKACPATAQWPAPLATALTALRTASKTKKRERETFRSPTRGEETRTRRDEKKE